MEAPGNGSGGPGKGAHARQEKEEKGGGILRGLKGFLTAAAALVIMSTTFSKPPAQQVGHDIP
jgi:hypothetical protein